jgi:hypothetical protein
MFVRQELEKNVDRRCIGNQRHGIIPLFPSRNALRFLEELRKRHQML